MEVVMRTFANALLIFLEKIVPLIVLITVMVMDSAVQVRGVCVRKDFSEVVALIRDVLITAIKMEIVWEAGVSAETDLRELLVKFKSVPTIVQETVSVEIGGVFATEDGRVLTVLERHAKSHA